MPHDAHVVHHIPGRIRIRLARSKRDIRSLQQIAESLGRMPGLRHLDINPATGSILVQYDPAAHPEFHRALARHAQETEAFNLRLPEIGEAAEDIAAIEQEAEFLAEHSRTALRVVTFMKRLNRQIRFATNNNLDLKVIMPGGLAVWAFTRAGKDAPTPLWVSLAVFSFNSFVALHRPTTRTTTVQADQQEG